MVDFDIKHYLEPEEDIDIDKRTQELREQFYGDMSEKPETEQELFALQEQYLKTRDHKIWVKMFEVAFPYIKSLILKKKKEEERSKWEESDEIAAKASTATFLFLSQYLKKPQFEVGASFAGMINGKILEVLYGGTHDFDVSLNSKINDDGDEIIDIFQLEGTEEEPYSPTSQFDKITIEEIIDDVFDEMDEVIDYDLRLEMLARLYVLLYFRKPKSRHAKKIFLSRNCKNQKEEDFLERVILEIHNRLKNS